MTTPDQPSRSDQLRRAFARFPSGVVALAAQVQGLDQVMVLSSFAVGVSLDPPLALCSIRHGSTTWPRLRSAARLGASVLAADQEELCRQLAASDPAQRWTGVDRQVTPDGAILLAGSPLSFETRIRAEHPAGDHDIVVLEIDSWRADSAIEPLVFHDSGFRRLL
ncbi:MAG: flavin reductase family protein [Propionibacteriaceae bacterium]|jgi:flavin reductase (DIM6/NTAB) family NADH-FMN oxidoreductase RutF|nr:flavin reductase family protein [Propionibacteriaceae bacterium]